MKVSELIERLQSLAANHGEQVVLLDTGMCLCEIDQVDLGGSDEGIIIWAGDLVPE
ncbi:MAG: hypothetical protein ACYC09_14960 [Bacteroidota bacterium]